MLRKIQISNDSTEHLGQLELNDKLAVVVSLSSVKYNKVMSRLNLHCFGGPNTIYGYSLKIFASKSFQHLNKLNRFIQCASEGGFIRKSLKGICYGPFSKKEPLYKYVEVKLETARSMLLIFCCLLVAAILQAVFEKFVYKKAQVKNAGIWKYVEMVIDDKRYFLLRNDSFKRE